MKVALRYFDTFWKLKNAKNIETMIHKIRDH